MKIGFRQKHLAHDGFTGLWKKAATAVKYWSNRGRFGSVFIEESPVTVMAVKVPDQSVYNENIPEMIPQERRVDVPLLIYGVQDI